MTNPVRVSRRRGGGAHVSQGRSFILLNRGELLDLIDNLTNVAHDDCPERAETVTAIDQPEG